jgi:hypothetical protein
MNLGAWQTATLFEGLSPNTGYAFEARLAETETHLASLPSAVVMFATGKPALTGTVTITGNAVVGETLRANTVGLTANPVISNLGTLYYQWKRDGISILNPVTSTYTGIYELMQADVGKTITVTVSAANCDGGVTSAATATVTESGVGVESLAKTQPLTAWPHNGILHVSGLAIGGQWGVYTVAGALVYEAKAESETATVALPDGGIYIVKQGGRAFKVVIGN